MNPRFLALRLLVLVSLAWIVPPFATAAAAVEVEVAADSEWVDFNSGWRFQLGDIAGAEQPGFNDSRWRELDLPHDWSIEFEHDPETPEGSAVGYLRGGTGWYRKTFVLPQAAADRGVDVVFDGVQQDCEVWINGHYLGLQAHGYIGFVHRLTPHLKSAGEPNVIAVRAINPDRHSRWYSGSGIYRNVALRFHAAVDVKTWGLLLNTTWIAKDRAQVQVRADIANQLETSERIDVALRVHRPDGTTEDHDLCQLQVAPRSVVQIGEQVTISNPQLWSPDSPVLYTAELRLCRRGESLGVTRQPFGIRLVTVSAREGFRLNGKPIELKGACLHHDNGLIGAAAFPAAEWRRVRLMKQNGFNAIRSSHNPPSAAFLDACDRLGVLVIDEFADSWELPKKPNGYSRHFASDWKRDLEAMMRRDFNHPSVVIWSIGNEIAERSRPRGIEIARQMIAQVRALDAQRPITNGVCDFYDYPDTGPNWDLAAEALGLLDIAGYNYTMPHYESDHAKYPNRVMMATESFPKTRHTWWPLVEKHPHVIGDFVWTGMDHLGESGVGNAQYVSAGDKQELPFGLPWPTWINWCGDIDIIGNKKPQSYYQDVVWDRSPVEIAVHEPVPDGKEERVSHWGWPNELPSWNWRGHEGKSLAVRVFSKAPRVRLELNGDVVGEKSVDRPNDVAVSFEVPYAPGELKALALNKDGAVLGTRSLFTSGRPAAFVALPELEGVRALRSQLVYVPIEVHDAAGRLVPDANLPFSLSIDGPVELLALGSANPSAMVPLRQAQTTTFRGRALLVLRSTGEPGVVNIRVNAEGVTGSPPSTFSLQ